MTVDETVGIYASAWCEADAAARQALLERVWAQDGVYQDPTADVQGRDALVAHIGGFHASMPGARIELSTGVSQHHGNIFFGWRLVTAEGATAVDGVDFGVLAPDGRIARITGFFGPPGT